MANPDAPSSDQQAMLDLLWGEPPRPSRGPKPTLTREQIARVGIVLADAEGLDALTMRRVAEQLGFTTMALYRHIRSKSELIAVMVDTAIGEALLAKSGAVSPREASPPTPSPRHTTPHPEGTRYPVPGTRPGEGHTSEGLANGISSRAPHTLSRTRERAGVRVNLAEAAEAHSTDAAWRVRLASWAEQNLALFQRHPWLLQADLPGVLIGPNRIAWIEAGLRTLDHTGLAANDRLEIVLFVYAYVHGSAQLTVQWGQDVSQAWQPTSPLMRRVRRDPRFPLFRSLLEAGDLDATAKSQAASDAASFAFGLERVLDGVAAYIAARP